MILRYKEEDKDTANKYLVSICFLLGFEVGVGRVTIWKEMKVVFRVIITPKGRQTSKQTIRIHYDR